MLPEVAWEVLEQAWLRGLAIEGNYSRRNRVWVAALASLGYVSIISADGQDFMREWRLTAEGAYALREHLEGE